MKIRFQYATTEGLQTEEFREIDAVGLRNIMEQFGKQIEEILEPLRSEIERENGQIVLTEDGIVDARGFSESLTQRMNALLLKAFESEH